jgi:protein KTI12
LKFHLIFDFEKDSNKEKELRGLLKSEVQKVLSKENIVILDSLNYIKGYRYELFCISKLIQTPQCVVSIVILKLFTVLKFFSKIYINRRYEECLKFNKSQPVNESYQDSM